MSQDQAHGARCPYCQVPIRAGDACRICPACQLPHHPECWDENGGCTAYGCEWAPQGAQGRAAAQARPPAPQAPAAPEWPGATGPAKSRAPMYAGLAAALLVVLFIGYAAGTGMFSHRPDAPMPSPPAAMSPDTGTQPITPETFMPTPPPPPTAPEPARPEPAKPEPAKPVRRETPRPQVTPPGGGPLQLDLVNYEGHGFRIKQPEGWTPKYEKVSYGERLSFSSNRFPDITIKVEWSPMKPGETAEANVRGLDQRFSSKVKSYQLESLEPCQVDGRDGWRWVFRRNMKDRQFHTVDVFVDDYDTGYAILCRAPSNQLKSWDSRFDEIIASFHLFSDP